MVNPNRTRLALAALALAAFVIGTSELVVVGVLDVIAGSLRVPVSTAGLLVTGYALGISLGGPVVAALTIRFGRRAVLRGSLAGYLAGNAVALGAVNFGMLLAARVVTGAIHGLFIGVASVVAAALVPPNRRGRAMSLMFGGIAVATVLGVPLGTLLGRALGWRATFLGIVVLGVLALLGTLLAVPPVAESASGGLAAQARFAFAPRVLAMLAVSVLLVGGQFTAFTYLTPFLLRVTGVPDGLVSVFLLVYGLACLAGTLVGGRLADRGPSATLIAANLVLAGALGALYLAGTVPVLTAALLAVWGFAGLGLVPSFQLRVISLAGRGADLAATLGASSVNAGIALGAAAGGWTVAGHGPHATVLVGAILCAVTLPATVASRFLAVPVSSPLPTPETAPAPR